MIVQALPTKPLHVPPDEATNDSVIQRPEAFPPRPTNPAVRANPWALTKLLVAPRTSKPLDAVDALQRHLKAAMQANPQRMHALKRRALEAFNQPETVYVVLDTRFLFPRAVCQNLFADLTNRRGTPFGTAADGQHEALKPLTLWLNAVLRGLGRREKSALKVSVGRLSCESANEFRAHLDRGQYFTATIALWGSATVAVRPTTTPSGERIVDRPLQEQDSERVAETGQTLIFGGQLRENLTRRAALLHSAPPNNGPRVVLVMVAEVRPAPIARLVCLG